MLMIFFFSELDPLNTQVKEPELPLGHALYLAPSIVMWHRSYGQLVPMIDTHMSYSHAFTSHDELLTCKRSLPAVTLALT